MQSVDWEAALRIGLASSSVLPGPPASAGLPFRSHLQRGQLAASGLACPSPGRQSLLTQGDLILSGLSILMTVSSFKTIAQILKMFGVLLQIWQAWPHPSLGL